MDPVTGAAVIGGVSSLLGIGASSSSNYRTQSKLMDKQYAYQQQLNAQQQQYARENADTQYNRQREFTADSWLLNRQGMENAGLNPAWMNGSSNPTASVDSAAAPNAGAAPSASAVPLDFSHSVAEGVGALTAVATSLSDKRLKDSEAERNNIDNMTRMQENIARLRELKANASTSEAKAQYENALKDLRIQYGKMSVRNQALILDNERANSDITAQLFGENAQNELALLRNKVAIAAQEGQLKKKEADNYIRELDARILNMQADSALKKVQTSVAPTQAYVNNSVARFNNSQSEFNEKSMFDRLDSARLANVPKDTKDLLMRSHWIRKYLDCVENGKKVPYEVEWHCDKLLLEYGLRDSQYKGISAGTIINAILR